MDRARVPVRVYKCGGTSVATPERIRHVVALIGAEPSTVRRVVVVSALGGVTDRLLAAVDEALARTGKHRHILNELRRRHDAATEVAAPGERDDLLAEFAARWIELGELLDGVFLLRECTPRTRDAVIGMGERLSAPLVAAAFRRAGMPARALDATRMIRTDAAFGEATVLFEPTRAAVRACIDACPPDEVAVVTGFIGATEAGVLTTLGRSGSDYTATLLGGALEAEYVVIWTDVDGVLSADPRLVPGAFTLPELSYREAAEMAYFGARVLHPRTMRPLQEGAIPLWIKNTLNPAASGTLITEASTPTEGRVKAVTAVRGVAVVMLEGTGLMGVPGISARTFGALADRHVNVLMISQASSEQTICMVVRQEDADAAVAALRDAFAPERHRRDVSRIYAMPDCAVVSVVGDQMRMQPGLAGRMFSTLGRANINVLAIAQGAAETNISAVVQEADAQRSVRALHEVFALAHERVHLCLIGAGGVGKALLNILTRQAPVLLETLGLDLRLVAVTNSRRMVFDPEGIPWADAIEALARETVAFDLDDLARRLAACHLERLVVVDATATESVARRYPDFLERGIAVVTPNKRGNTLEQAFYDRLQHIARRRQVPYLYETTVGAGLPVLSTLRDLIRSGDRILRIDGVLSGTLAFVLSRVSAGRPFSEAVAEAHQRGYTEPDPREDLSGADVGRKLLVLARESGLRLEGTSVQAASLVPVGLHDVPLPVFWERLAEADAAWAGRVAADGRLQYVGRIEAGRLSASVTPVTPDAPFARLDGTENMVVFTTERYRDRPLVVQGHGAGPDVTAAGVLADVVQAACALA